MARWLVPLLCCCCSVVAAAGTSAVFRGEVVRSADAGPHVIFVLGRNGALRKVRVSGAQVSYAHSVPPGARERQPLRGLKHGAEVRVTADENGEGLWRAQSIEILRAAGQRSETRPPKVDSDSKTPQLSRRN